MTSGSGHGTAVKFNIRDGLGIVTFTLIRRYLVLQLTRVLYTSPLLASFVPQASYINRAEPVYRHFAGISTDRDPPAAPVNNWIGAVFTLRNIRKTKIYDLAAAMPLVFWYGLGIRGLLPRIGAQSLQRLDSFDALALMAVVSQALTIGFMTVQIVLFILRRVPERRCQGFWPRTAVLAQKCIWRGNPDSQDREPIRSAVYASRTSATGTK
jgi:hypothetical protein